MTVSLCILTTAHTHTHAAICLGLLRWASTTKNIHPLTPILINRHALSTSSIKKAFDSISFKLWVTMMDVGYPLHLIDLLVKLYRKQLAKVKVAGTQSQWFRVKKGVRQGCVLFPYLFNILAEMKANLDGFQGGLQIRGQMITNLC